jgi:hypothetical protein
MLLERDKERLLSKVREKIKRKDFLKKLRKV